MISFSWDTRQSSVILKWSKLVSLEWTKGKAFVRVLGLPIPLAREALRSSDEFRLTHVKEAARFIREWRLDDLEGSFSFPDPMVNGVLYGLGEVFDLGQEHPKRKVTVNFVGENWLSGEASLSNVTLLRQLAAWVLPLIRHAGKTGKER